VSLTLSLSLGKKKNLTAFLLLPLFVFLGVHKNEEKHVTHKKKMGSVKGEEKKKKEHTSHNTIPCKQFCLVKRMIRGFRVEKTLTYSQTLNRQTAHYLSINVVSVCFFLHVLLFFFLFLLLSLSFLCFIFSFLFCAHLHTVAMIFGRVIFQVHESVVGTKKKKKRKKKKKKKKERERLFFFFLSFFFFSSFLFSCAPCGKKLVTSKQCKKKRGEGKKSAKTGTQPTLLQRKKRRRKKERAQNKQMDKSLVGHFW
jgi:hypothetical protein